MKKELINDQLSPPSDKISFTKRNISFWASPAYFEFFGLIIALTILIIGFKYWKIRKEKEKEYIANQSENIALKHLEKANTLKLNKNFQDFYEEISRATNGYLKEKYNIQNIDSGLFQMTEYLRSVGISEFWIDEYAFIQKQCEMAKFAGQYGDTDLIYTKAESLLRFFSKTVA